MNTRYLIAMLVAMLAGCTHLGPQTVTRDRFDYNTAISDSWKEQTLLNIVKLRYADMPLFVEVASIVSGYTLEGSINLAGTLSSSDSLQRDALSLGSSGKYTDRPTITYAPITGSHFNKSFMTPLPPQAILFLMQSGWPADLIFPLTVDAVNGLRSRVAAGANQRAGDPGYYRVVELLRKVQKSGAIGMRIKQAEEAQGTTVMFFHRETLSPEMQAALGEIEALLGLQPGLREASISYGFIPQSDTEIAFLTRSTLQIMINLATGIDVPPEHVAQGFTVPSPDGQDAAGVPQASQLLKVRYGKERPGNALTAVKYHDYWFWIDDGDFRSKRSFGFLMILFSLTETGGKEGLPLVTIPAS
jgi:hypothetical protein